MGIGIGSALAPIGLQTPLLLLATIILRAPKALSFIFFELAKLIPLPVYLYIDYKTGGVFIKGPPLTLEFFENVRWDALKVYVARFFVGGFILYFASILLFFLVYLFLKGLKQVRTGRENA